MGNLGLVLALAGFFVASAHLVLVVAERNDLSSTSGRVTCSPLGCPPSRPTLPLICHTKFAAC